MPERYIPAQRYIHSGITDASSPFFRRTQKVNATSGQVLDSTSKFLRKVDEIVSNPGMLRDTQSTIEGVLKSIDSVLDGNKTLRDKLAEARNAYVVEQQGKNKIVKAYEVDQDVVVYRVLQQQKQSREYDIAKQSLDAYTKMQLETHLGERLNVGISQLHHNIVDGELRVADTDESLLEMLKRGRDYRREHGKQVDWDREAAEPIGFERIEKELADPNTPVGTMMFNITPPGDIENGSIYKNNFYDVHYKVSQRRVISFRFTSGLTPEESQKRLKVLDKRYDRKEIPTEAEFIANPVKVLPGTKGLENPDAIHNFMHVDHKYMSREKFTVIIQACQPLINEYIQSLVANPDNIVEHKRRLDILMNYADNVADELISAPEGRMVDLFDHREDVHPWFPPQIDRNALARQKVREVDTGCGSSGGESPSSVFSVSEFAPSKEGGNCTTCNQSSADNHYHCPGCTKKYADETHVENRTKQCSCGFEFGC